MLLLLLPPPPVQLVLLLQLSRPYSLSRTFKAGELEHTLAYSDGADGLLADLHIVRCVGGAVCSCCSERKQRASTACWRTSTSCVVCGGHPRVSGRGVTGGDHTCLRAGQEEGAQP